MIVRTFVSLREQPINKRKIEGTYFHLNFTDYIHRNTGSNKIMQQTRAFMVVILCSKIRKNCNHISSRRNEEIINEDSVMIFTWYYKVNILFAHKTTKGLHFDGYKVSSLRFRRNFAFLLDVVAASITTYSKIWMNVRLNFSRFQLWDF